MKIIPNSAVAIDRKGEAQPFRSKVDGFLPLSRHRSAVLGEDTKPHANDVRERKNDFEISQSESFAASGFRLASDIFGLTAESGIMLTRNLAAIAACLALCVLLAACSADLSLPDANRASDPVTFGPEQRLGDNEKNPSTP